MTPIKVTTIPIWPSTNVRANQGEFWILKKTDEWLAEYDAKRLLTKGKKGRNVQRKHQLEKYMAFKEEVRSWAAQNGFTIVHGYFAIWFYLPMPRSWRPKQRAAMIGKPHQSTPDFDNLLKALFDALMPRRNRINGEKGADDRRIHCCGPFKVWVDADDARMEIVEYEAKDYIDAFWYPGCSLQ